MAQIDKKNRNVVIGIVAAVLIIVAAIGIAVWVLADNKQPKAPSTPYVNDTADKAPIQQVGSVSLAPKIVALKRGPDGRMAGQAALPALFQDFYVTSIKFEGDTRLGQSSDCPSGTTPLKAGTHCTITVTFSPNNSDPNAKPEPSLVVDGETRTPGGDKLIAEGRAQITGAAPDGAQAAAGQAGSIPGALPGQTGLAGQSPLQGQPGAAPNGIDPYGPVNASQVQQAQAGSPPVNYGRQPVGPRPLTAREQFILARRQAVLGNVVLRDAQTNQQVSSGDWDEIKVPRVVSSAPQDMSRVVTMDRIITVALSRPFDSRQNQQVVAQVDRNVYGAMGRNILIPRGSTVIGTMTATADRAAVVWTQIIRPDGARFVFQGSGGDAMGQAGVPGHVNNRWFARLGAGFLGTILKVTTAIASNAQQTAVVATTPGAGDGIGQTLAPTTAQNNGAIVTNIVTQDINAALAPIIAKAQALQPIITVPAGTRMTIVPSEDLVMRPIDRPTVVRPSYPRAMNGGAQISAPPQIGDGSLQGSGDQGQSSPMQQQQQQASAARVLTATPGAPTTTPPWGSN